MYLLLKYCLLVFHLKMHSLIKKKKLFIYRQRKSGLLREVTTLEVQFIFRQGKASYKLSRISY